MSEKIVQFNEELWLYNKCWCRVRNPIPFLHKKVEHTSKIQYNKSTPTQLKGLDVCSTKIIIAQNC